MAKGLNISDPPRRKSEQTKKPAAPSSGAEGEKFTQVAEGEIVQFNKRIPRGVADSYEILAIRTRRKVPDLLCEGLLLLEEKYGKA